jgi:hypothetical protein
MKIGKFYVFLVLTCRLEILPTSNDDADGLPSPIALCPPVDEEGNLRVAVSPPNLEAKYFELLDLELLFEALRYGNSFSGARNCVLGRLKSVVDSYVRKMGGLLALSEVSDSREPPEHVRQEIWDLVRVCRNQEKKLLLLACTTLTAELQGPK